MELLIKFLSSMIELLVQIYLPRSFGKNRVIH